MKSSSTQIYDAMNRWKSGEFTTFAECEAATDVLRQTIQKRLNGAISYREAHEEQQKMPPETEHILVKWIQTEDLSENASDYARTRVMAKKILRFVSLPSDLGEN